jgi:hypothetical protein
MQHITIKMFRSSAAKAAAAAASIQVKLAI